jgi:hypothetical protein
MAMRKVVDKKERKIVTSDGQVFIHRITTVLCPNGRYRYPEDYFDATPGAVKISEQERKATMIPAYKTLI